MHLPQLRNRKHILMSKLSETFFILPQTQRHLGKVFRQLGILLFQKGHHMMPQAVSKELIRFVRAVLNMR